MDYTKRFLLAVGIRIKYLRLKAGLMLKELAVSAGIGCNYLCEIESGKNIGLKHLCKIAKALQKPAYELLMVHKEWHRLMPEIKQMEKDLALSRKRQRSRFKKKSTGREPS